MATSTLGSGTLVLAGTTSGTTTVTATAVAGTTTLTLPAATDTLVGKATTDTLTNKTLTGAVMNGTLGATTPSTVAATTLTTSSTVTHNGGTANGVPYLDGSKVLTTGSALVFDGSNLGLGVTPSAWASFSALQLGETGCIASNAFSAANTQTFFANNVYYDGAYKYIATGSAAAQYIFIGSEHRWNIAPSGTAGNAITFTQAMTLDASGNLGIGTTSPANYAGYKTLTINGASTGGEIDFQAAGTQVGFWASSNSSTGFGSTVSAPVIFYTNGSERARIDTSGNLLVGTTSAVTGARLSSVAASGSQAAAFKSDASTAVTILNLWGNETSGNQIFVRFATDSNAERGSITYNRGAGVIAYNVTSDYRAKDINGPVADSGALIDSVPVYMGKMKGATQERPMFIAHETPAYAHVGEKDAVDADGKPVYQQMDASALIPVMWAEIQSLRKRLATAGI